MLLSGGHLWQSVCERYLDVYGRRTLSAVGVSLDGRNREIKIVQAGVAWWAGPWRASAVSENNEHCRDQRLCLHLEHHASCREPHAENTTPSNRRENFTSIPHVNHINRHQSSINMPLSFAVHAHHLCHPSHVEIISQDIHVY
jgi:hypothetical protein